MSGFKNDSKVSQSISGGKNNIAQANLTSGDFVVKLPWAKINYLRFYGIELLGLLHRPSSDVTKANANYRCIIRSRVKTEVTCKC